MEFVNRWGGLFGWAMLVVALLTILDGTALFGAHTTMFGDRISSDEFSLVSVVVGIPVFVVGYALRRQYQTPWKELVSPRLSDFWRKHDLGYRLKLMAILVPAFALLIWLGDQLFYR